MILNVLKPRGWTSFDVVSKARGIIGTKKIGHAGTLDPLAEGVLILLTDKDTKKQGEFMLMKKEYIAEIAFGVESETYDMEKTPKFVKDTSIEFINSNLEKTIKNFIGEIEQKVPPYSAVQLNGQRLYKIARKGNISKIDIPVKRIKIYKIDVLDVYARKINTTLGVKELPIAKIKIECASGTYIRSLAHDLGQNFNTGAVLYSLIRTKVGKYSIEDSKDIQSLQC